MRKQSPPRRRCAFMRVHTPASKRIEALHSACRRWRLRRLVRGARGRLGQGVHRSACGRAVCFAGQRLALKPRGCRDARSRTIRLNDARTAWFDVNRIQRPTRLSCVSPPQSLRRRRWCGRRSRRESRKKLRLHSHDVQAGTIEPGEFAFHGFDFPLMRVFRCRWCIGVGCR